jgi:hypothetical protein
MLTSARRREILAVLDGLASGASGYSEAFRYRAALPAWAVLQYDDEFRKAAESELTNLDKINPATVIYRRDP